MRTGLHVALWLLVGLFVSEASAQSDRPDSGGPLLPEQEAYDVTHYDLDVTVDPDARTIEGTLTTQAVVLKPLDAFVLNLDRRLRVDRASVPSSSDALPVERRADSNQVWIALPDAAAPGDTLQVTVTYGGAPRVAPKPPWNGGVTWDTTPGGAPWIATSCQTAGADLWWPVKDHPSDEPDSMDVAVTVPDTLVAASNGTLRGTSTPREGWRTYRWHVPSSINAYGVALNVAPYERLDDTYTSVDGTDVPVSFYVVPSDTAQARASLPQFLEHVRFLEETLGPYPFRDQKYGIAQTPFLGMEHQTIIAYGHDFRSGGLGYDMGFDALHFHELGHEWFGNCVTVDDWKDFWLHEGTTTYLEALYAESLRGDTGYRTLIRYFRSRVSNRAPIAQTEPTSAQGVYGADVYFKGALVLHTLRYVIGDDALRTVLRRFATPKDASASSSDARRCRHVTTADFVQLAEDVSGRELDGFFMGYLYQATPPRLDVDRSRRTLRLEWSGVDGIPFEVPVPVRVNDTVRRIRMEGGRATVTVPRGAEVVVDPDDWILRE